MPNNFEKPPAEQELSTEVEVRTDSEYPEVQDTWIHIGNSGLAIRRLQRPDGAEEWSMDYTPEGAFEASPENRIKYATIFGHALFKFLEWLASPEAAKSLPSRPGIIRGMTNRVMMEYRQNLLGEAIRVTEADKDNDQYWYDLDLNALMGNKKNMSRLEALSRRAETQHYKIAE